MKIHFVQDLIDTLRGKYKESEAAIVIQDTLDLSKLQNSKKIIVFLTPGTIKINGGVMSIFSLCATTRDICQDAYCLLSTFPNGKTYVINDKFCNNEKILRFDQIVNNAKNVQEMILHIPEYYAGIFYKDLKKNDIEFLKFIPNLQINIMNQNIELMPEPEELQDLYRLTDNITQTMAHNRYATQEVCNKWQMPTHLFSTYSDKSMYKKYSFDEKEKIIVLSPDENPNKEKIVEKLKTDFPDWQFVTVQNMTFNEYMDLVGRAYFTITFGEGMDGYFSQPACVGGLGFAVYNDNFFPNNSWKDLENVFETYDEMYDSISNKFRFLVNNPNIYQNIIKTHINKKNELYSYEGFKDNLKRFYEQEYDFLPKGCDKIQ